MAIGPSKGNGFEWDRGPWRIGVWQEALGQGLGDATVLGHKEGAAWVIDDIIQANGDDGGWQSQINFDANGLIGSYWITKTIPKINNLLDVKFPLNPYIGTPIKNTDAYTKDRFNALIAQYTDVGSDGKLGQKGFVSRIIAAVLG